MTEWLPFGDCPLEPTAHSCTVQEAPFLFLSFLFLQTPPAQSLPTKQRHQKLATIAASSPDAASCPTSAKASALTILGHKITTFHLQCVKPSYISLGTTSLTSTSETSESTQELLCSPCTCCYTFSVQLDLAYWVSRETYNGCRGQKTY